MWLIIFPYVNFFYGKHGCSIDAKVNFIIFVLIIGLRCYLKVLQCMIKVHSITVYTCTIYVSP